jgi:hypothetical protein
MLIETGGWLEDFEAVIATDGRVSFELVLPAGCARHRRRASPAPDPEKIRWICRIEGRAHPVTCGLSAKSGQK